MNIKGPLKGIAYNIISLFGLTVIVFILARILPGSIDALATLALGPNASSYAIHQFILEFHLRAPLYLQYWYWINGIFTGNWGISLISHRNVLLDVEQYLPATLNLVIVAAIMDILIALPLGLIAGIKENMYADHIIRIISYIGIAVPPFVVAIILQLFLGYDLHIFPIIGLLSPGISPPPHITGIYIIDALITGQFNTWINVLWHLILPAFSLILGNFAQESRILRASVIQNKNSDYALSEAAYGIPGRVILIKYLLKPSLIPMITIYGLDTAYIITNAFLIELIFNIPGFSRYALTAILAKDLNAIIAAVLVIGIFFVIANALVDYIVSVLDPRISKEESV